MAIEEAQLSAADASAGGVANGVDISGDTLVVGNPADSPGGIAHAGSVVVFLRNGATWTQQAKLTALDASPNAVFGASVALSGDTLVVGAPAGSVAPGAAYVFVREGASWSQQAKLMASDGAIFDYFGYAVGVSGDSIVVGANFHSLPGLTFVGAAYVFRRDETTWSQQAKLQPLDIEGGDHLGWDVDISGDTLVIGAPEHYTGLSGANSGAAYVFVFDGVSWIQQAELIAPFPVEFEELGFSVALSGNTVVAGGPSINGRTGSGPGIARVFVRTGTAWSQQATLLPTGASSQPEFGWEVAIDGDTAVIASRWELVSGLYAAGAAYVFTRAGAAWTQQCRLISSDAAPGDDFGIDVALSGDTVVAGTADNDGNPADWGRAHVFHLQGAGGPWTNLGFGLAGLGGLSNLGASGSLVAGSPGQLALTGAKPLSPAYLIVGPGTTPAPFKGGTLVPLPVALILPLATNASGAISLSWPAWPAGAPPGLELDFQYVIPDAAAPHGMALSNALRAITP